MSVSRPTHTTARIAKPELLFVASSHPAKRHISCEPPHRIAISNTLQIVFRTAGR